MQTRDIGEPVPLDTKWWDDDGAPAEPSAITVTVTKPDGTTTTILKAALTGSSSTGGAVLDVWSTEVIGDQTGLWRVHAVGTVAGDSTIPMDLSFLVDVDTADGPCEQWASWEDVLRCGTVNGEPDSASIDLWLDQATELLYLLSGRKYPGICTVTRSLCFACHSCFPTICSCDPYPGIDLGGAYPVWAAWDVMVEGVTLPASAHAMRGKRWLVRTDGQVWTSTGWNIGQDPNQFRATWAYGRPVPTGGRLAAARFALEIAKLCTQDKSCALPQRITTVQREGITYTVLDSMNMVAEGRTGLPLVDLWLVADRKADAPEPHIYHPALGASRRV